MKDYLNLNQEIVERGHMHEDRTGVGRQSLFGRDLRSDISEGTPYLTTKKMNWKHPIIELLWFISGNRSVVDLQEAGVNIWNEWTPTEEDIEPFVEHLIGKGEPFLTTLSIESIRNIARSRIGTIGPMYGAVWRGNYGNGHFSGQSSKHPDQLAELIKNLKANPFGSRHCVTAWIPDLLPISGYSPKQNVLLGRGALAPCHCFFQCFVSPPKKGSLTGKNRLSLKLEIRSNDMPLGNPYNRSQYAVFLMMLAQCTGMEPYELIISIGDAHIYSNQLETMSTVQLQRTPTALPMMQINQEKTDIDSFTIDDFHLTGYDPQSAIKYPIAV